MYSRARCPDLYYTGSVVRVRAVFWLLGMGMLAACTAQQPPTVLVGQWPERASGGEIRSYEKALEADPADVSARVALARSYGSRGRWSDAVKQAILAVESDPNSADGFIVLSQAYANEADWARAMTAARNALKLDPGRAEGYFGLGWSYVNLHQWEQARDALVEAIAIRPDYFDAYRALGIASARLQDFPTAMRSWNKALALRPDADDLKKDKADLIASLEKALQPFRDRVAIRPDDWASYAALGDRATFSGLFGEALPAYFEAVRLGVSPQEPKRSAQLFYNIGIVYRESEDWKRATVMFERAILLDPKSATAYYNVGLIQSRGGDDRAAIVSFKKAVEYEHHSVVPFVALGEAYARTGQISAALDQYQIVKDADPEKAEALLERIRAAQSGKRRSSGTAHRSGAHAQARTTAQADSGGVTR